MAPEETFPILCNPPLVAHQLASAYENMLQGFLGGFARPEGRFLGFAAQEKGIASRFRPSRRLNRAPSSD
jgi:hypothetical protein